MKDYYFGEGCVYLHIKTESPLVCRCTRYDNKEYDGGWGSCNKENCPLVREESK